MSDGAKSRAATEAPANERVWQRGWVRILVILFLVGAFFGITKLRAYYARRTPLTAEWAAAFRAADRSADGATVVSVADFAPVPLGDDEILMRVEGSNAGDWFGSATADVGDVNFDGTPDFAVGAHQNENFGKRPAPNAAPGYVHVYSGRDGALIHTLKSSGGMHIDGADDHFGYSISSAADVDGDGAPEIAVGAYLFDADDGIESTFDENTGGLFLFSGASGELLRRLKGELWGDRFGYMVGRVGDHDGDGLDDLLVSIEKDEGPTGIKNPGAIAIHSSATGVELLYTSGPGWEAHFGSSLAGIGDADGDGVSDYVGGAFMYAHFEAERAARGAAGIVSGGSGVLHVAWDGELRNDHLGTCVANLGDVDGDGRCDVAVSASQSGWVGDFAGAGFVALKSGATGREIARITGAEVGDQFGWWIASSSDRDGDGAADLLVGAPRSLTLGDNTGKRGCVYLVSGRTGAVLAAVEGTAADDQFGTSVCEIGDVNGDGLREVLVGAPENVRGQTRPGHALVISGAAFR